MTEPAFLAIDGLSIALGSRGPRLLRAVGLSVARGQIHGLVGESGAGKSMIGKAVLGLLPRGVRVAGGRILLEGIDLGNLRAAARRRLIGERVALIPQDPLSALNPCRRIAGQMTDRLTHTLGWKPDKARARALELLEEVHIRDPLRVFRAYPHELSGGMRQRVLIAAAFAAEPHLVIADEPTTALDVTVQKQILRLIGELQTRHATAMLFVTHDMGVVAKICQQVTVLYGGMVVEQAPTAKLFGDAEIHPYTRALIAATPRYDQPDRSLLPVDGAVIEALARDIERADGAWREVPA